MHKQTDQWRREWTTYFDAVTKTLSDLEGTSARSNINVLMGNPLSLSSKSAKRKLAVMTVDFPELPAFAAWYSRSQSRFAAFASDTFTLDNWPSNLAKPPNEPEGLWDEIFALAKQEGEAGVVACAGLTYLIYARAARAYLKVREAKLTEGELESHLN